VSLLLWKITEVFCRFSRPWDLTSLTFQHKTILCALSRYEKLISTESCLQDHWHRDGKVISDYSMRSKIVCHCWYSKLFEISYLESEPYRRKWPPIMHSFYGIWVWWYGIRRRVVFCAGLTFEIRLTLSHLWQSKFVSVSLPWFRSHFTLLSLPLAIIFIEMLWALPFKMWILSSYLRCEQKRESQGALCK
jgi:hypothetical protein